MLLIVDDENDICEVLKMLFENDGYSAITANDGRQAINTIEENEEFLDLVISDLRMPGIDGMDILNYMQEKDIDIPLILITAYGTINIAVEAMKNGAADFITKPFNNNVIRHVVNRVLHVKNLVEENRLLKSAMMADRIVYQSQAMKEIMETVGKVSRVSTPILITGKSGTGKELVARAIHSFSLSKPFIKITCPAIPENLIESELFGYKKGAFTGATANFQGKAKLADGGTLFLDEIADLPLMVQPKLLRLLEEKSFEPLGSNVTFTINTRVICATNRDLEILVRAGEFREDLYYRINTVTIEIPTLRQRKEEILPLAEFFLKKYTQEMGKKRIRLSDEVKCAFLSYSWPGNVRELRNVIERAIVLSSNPILNLADFPAGMWRITSASHGSESNTLAKNEMLLLHETLKKFNWNVSAAARELDISRDKMRYRIKKSGLNKWAK